MLAESITAALALLAAAVTGDIMLVALAAPLGLAAVLALTSERPEPPSVATSVTPLVTSPGEPVEVVIEIEAIAGDGVAHRAETGIGTRVGPLPAPAKWTSSSRPPFTPAARPGGGCCFARAALSASPAR